MTKFSNADRVIALSGVFQGAQLARDIAHTGTCDSLAMDASRATLFEFDPTSVSSVFGGTKGVVVGLRSLHRQLAEPGQRDMEVSRYVVALLHLADRLRANATQLQALGTDLNALARRSEQLDLDKTTQDEQLSQIYQERISPLGPRIMVRGDPGHLQQAENPARIRVVLLSGVRAAVLWRQTGGRKWQLLLQRRSTASAARDLVDKIDSAGPLNPGHGND